jgi:glycosyltransferase involved in cell wall biosynthesis
MSISIKDRFLLFEAYDFEAYPTGGSGTFCNNIIKSCKRNVALVGITTNKLDRVGFWGIKTISGFKYDYFPVRYVQIKHNRKPIIPARLSWFFYLRKYKKEILNYGCSNVFLQAPDTLLAISNWNFKNVCYVFAGLNNPIENSKYRWAKIFGKLFFKVFVSKFKYVKTFLAASSTQEIKNYCKIVESYGYDLKIIQFPTRIDTAIFYPMKKRDLLRKNLSFNSENKILLTSGRLSEIKGWRLILESFSLFLKDFPNSYLLFVGDGEDRDKISSHVQKSGLSKRVKLMGFQNAEQLSELLNMSDLFLMASFYEGWPTSMIEAIACGIPICTTNFGSAEEIVINDRIGTIAKDRNPENFVCKMKEAILINFDEQVHAQEMKKYSIENLGTEILGYFDISLS